MKEKTRESKGSMRKGNRTKKAPAHQNKFAFAPNKVNKTSKLSKAIGSIDSTSGMCEKCVGIIEWKKQYRKYKLQKMASKCGWCEEKVVKLAYHTICRPCANTKKVCTKCLVKLTSEEMEVGTRSMTVKEIEHALDHSLVKQRHAKSILRRHENGTITDEEIRKIVARSNGEQGEDGKDEGEDEGDDRGDDVEEGMDGGECMDDE